MFIKNKGFTIIEAIVVVAIILSFFSITVSNFSKSKLQFSLSRVVFKFGQDLSRAQNMALSDVPYKDSLGVEHQVDGYGLHVDLIGLGNKKYIIYADKSPGNQQYDVADYTVETIDFSLSEPGIVISQINNITGSNVSVNFNSSNLLTTINSISVGQTDVFFVFAQSANLLNTKSVLANKSGLIEVQ